MCSDFFCDSCIRVSLAENSVEKQGIPSCLCRRLGVSNIRHREAFESYLQENNEKGDIIIVFGGFYKLPGVGGIGCHCYYEFGSKEQV